MSSFVWRFSKLTKQRRLGRGLEALLGRTATQNQQGPQIHVPPEEETKSTPTDPEAEASISVNQSPQQPVTPRRVEPFRRTDSGISLEPNSGESKKEEDSESVIIEPTGTAEAPAESPSTIAHAIDGDEATETILRVDIHLIEANPYQPRKDFSPEELEQLSKSLEEHGMLQPLVVRRIDESYQLIAGERRLRAAQAAGWQEVPVKVIEAKEDRMTELALVENLQRQDLNAMEKAASFKQYLKSVGGTQEELAKRLKLDRSTVANMIRLLELPEQVQTAVRQGKITQGHARALLPLGDERRQIEFAERVEREGLSVRATERLVQETIDEEDREPLADIARGKKTRKPATANEQIASLEQEFRSALGVKVKLTHNAKGRGKLVIHFANHEEFERLQRHINGTTQATSNQ